MIYDISMLIHPNMQTYKNNKEKAPIFKTNQDIKTSTSHDTTVTLNLHTGTHMDYPLHMVRGGADSSSENLNQLITEARVLDLSHLDDKVSKADLVPYKIKENEFILLKTKNSFSDAFLSDFVYLDKDAAKYLSMCKVKGVGTDGLGIERAQKNHETHKTLLKNGIVIIEGLRLKEIKEDTYSLIFLPLKIKGVEASLGRAVLIK
jgi:arylformamidase